MSRPSGSRNANYEQQRVALLRSIRARLAQPDGARASFRDLAESADVSVATLRHYFSDREGTVAAVLSHSHSEGTMYLLELAAGPLLPLEQSVSWVLSAITFGFAAGVDRVFTVGLHSGLGHPTLGPECVVHVLEPMVQATEARLARHAARGELLQGTDLRHAALCLLSPLLVGLLHQGPLGGDRCRPLDVGAFNEDHARAFVRAFGAPSGPSRHAGTVAPERDAERDEQDPEAPRAEALARERPRADRDPPEARGAQDRAPGEAPLLVAPAKDQRRERPVEQRDGQRDGEPEARRGRERALPGPQEGGPPARRSKGGDKRGS